MAGDDPSDKVRRRAQQLLSAAPVAN